MKLYDCWHIREDAMEEFLEIKDFNLAKTKVDLQELKKFQCQEQYVSVGVELLKEAARITTLCCCPVKMTP